MNKNNQILRSENHSIFNYLTKNYISKLTSKNQLVLVGRINNPGIYTLHKNMTLDELITKGEGIRHKSNFKFALIGMANGYLMFEEDLDKQIDVNVLKYDHPSVIIFSSNDCAVEFSIYYLEYLLNEKEKILADDIKIKQIIKLKRLFDLISKGQAKTVDIYTIREELKILKQLLPNAYILLDEVFRRHYNEILTHVEKKMCPTLECSNLAKITILTKCIGCDKCKPACPVNCIVGEFRKQHIIDYDRCTHCGACIQVCPVNAITSGTNSGRFLRDLGNERKTIVVQIAPSIRVSLGEGFDFPLGVNIENKISAGLRQLGVKYVFDTSYGADLTVVEEEKEFSQRFEKYLNGDKSVKLPILTSCCPSWVKFFEKEYPDLLDVPSSAKSPMEMLASVTKNIWAREIKIPKEDLIMVAIMPCTAKKYEAAREEFSTDLIYDVDYVIMTSELIDIFKKTKIDLASLDDAPIDKIMGNYTGSGIIFGRTGGVLEAVVRSYVKQTKGIELEESTFDSLKGQKGFRKLKIEIDDLKLNLGVVNGLEEAREMLDRIRNNEEFFHVIEIMACPGGCINGGGQPKVAKNRDEVLISRSNGLNTIYNRKKIKVSNFNPEIIKLYEKYLDYPLSPRAKELLHTHYFKK